MSIIADRGEISFVLDSIGDRGHIAHILKSMADTVLISHTYDTNESIVMSDPVQR